MPPHPLTLRPDDHQPSLRQVADRLITLTQTLRREHDIPEELAEELNWNSAGSYRLPIALESLAGDLPAVAYSVRVLPARPDLSQSGGLA